MYKPRIRETDLDPATCQYRRIPGNYSSPANSFELARPAILRIGYIGMILQVLVHC